MTYGALLIFNVGQIQIGFRLVLGRTPDALSWDAHRASQSLPGRAGRSGVGNGFYTLKLFVHNRHSASPLLLLDRNGFPCPITNLLCRICGRG
jgi:hypothetical protein